MPKALNLLAVGRHKKKLKENVIKDECGMKNVIIKDRKSSERVEVGVNERGEVRVNERRSEFVWIGSSREERSWSSAKRESVVSIRRRRVDRKFDKKWRRKEK